MEIQLIVLLLCVNYARCVPPQNPFPEILTEDLSFQIFARRWDNHQDAKHIDGIVVSSQEVLAVCQQSFDEAEVLLEANLRNANHILSSEHVNVSALVDRYDSFQDNLQWTLFDKEEQKLDVKGRIVHHVLQLLATIKHACHMIPSAVSMEHTEEELEAVFFELIKWSESTLSQIETQLDEISEMIFCSPDFKEFLKNIHEILGKMAQNPVFSEILQYVGEVFGNMKSDAPTSARETISRMEDLFLYMANPLQPFDNDPYWITKGFTDKYLQKSMHSQSNDPIRGEIEIDDDTVVAEVPKEFLSVALGAHLIQHHFKSIHHKRQLFLNLASGLSPAMLRMGGSAANFLTYQPLREDNNISPTHKGWASERDHKQSQYHPKAMDRCEKQLEADFTNFTMTGLDWDFLTGLSTALEWPLLFDLNQFKRDANGQWDASNAQLLFTDPTTQSTPIIWQLGNEPNSYAHKFGWSISAHDSAMDYIQLRKQLDKYFTPASQFLLMGPDVTRPRKFEDIQEQDLGQDSMKYLAQFLQKANHVIDAVGWHQYYMNGRTAKLDDFLSVEMMNIFPQQVSAIVTERDTHAPGKPIWLTETACAWGGGAPGLSQSFAGGFLWLDKLGSAAFGGVSVVFRQTLVGGCYGMLDKDLTPTPSFWLSILHKQLVGEKVLLPRVRLASPNIRVYAHCLRDTNRHYKPGAVVVFGMNVGSTVESLTILGKPGKTSELYHYRLTAPLNDLTSRNILLNHEVMEASPDGTIPVFDGVSASSPEMIFAPGSFSFYIMPDAAISVCM